MKDDMKMLMMRLNKLYCKRHLFKKIYLEEVMRICFDTETQNSYSSEINAD